MATPHPQTLLALENFLKSSPLGQYILRRNPVYFMVRVLTILITAAALLVAFILYIIISSTLNHITTEFFTRFGEGVVSLYMAASNFIFAYPLLCGSSLALLWVTDLIFHNRGFLRLIPNLQHHLFNTLIFCMQLNPRLAQFCMRIALEFRHQSFFAKMLTWLNCVIIKLFHSDAAVDKLNVSLLEYKNLLARGQDYFIQHGGISPTQTLAQFTQGLLTQLETGNHYDDLQTLLRLGAFHTDFSITALQYYRNNYLDRIIAPITNQLEHLRKNNDLYFSALPKDILNITSSYVAANLYPQLANWVLDEMAKPVEAAKTVTVTVTVTRLGG